MEGAKHILVIGAGVIGLCAAYYLQREGYQVTVVDASAEGGDSASYGNGGLIVPSHFVPLAAPGMAFTGAKMMLDRSSPFGFNGMTDPEVIKWIPQFLSKCTKEHVDRCSPILARLHIESRELSKAILADTQIDADFKQHGLAMVCKTWEALHHEADLIPRAEEFGLTAQVFEGHEVSKVDESYTENVTGAVLYHDDAQMNPKLFMAGLGDYLESKGVQIWYGVTVTSLNWAGNKVTEVITSAGPVQADEFVIASGVWSRDLCASFGMTLPMLGGKGYGISLPDVHFKPSVPSILVEARVAVTPMRDVVRFVGTMELGRLDTTVTPQRLEGLKSSISDYYTNFARPMFDRPVWAGLRPCSPDGMPYVGRAGRAQNLIVATGHGMMGFSLGPVTGQIVSQVVSGTTPPYDISLLSPDRYAPH